MNRSGCLAALAALLLALPAQADELLLDKIVQRLTANSVLHANFTQSRHMAALKNPLTLSGNMAFSRQEGLIWQIAKPYNITYAMTATNVTEILPDGSKRERSARDVPGVGVVGGLLRSMISGDKSLLTQYFTVSAQGSPEAWTLQLFPKTGPMQKAIHHVELAGGEQMEHVMLQDADGGSTLIRFSAIDITRSFSTDELKLLSKR